MTAVAAASFAGRDLELELLDPGSTPLVRLFRQPGGDWEPPPEAHRKLRVDPPAGQKSAFAVVYTATTLPTVAIECRVLSADANDSYTWDVERAQQYQVVRYEFASPALFIPIDGRNRSALGLFGAQRKFAGYEPYQAVAQQLFLRYASVVHGLSWESFHRNQPGRVLALWHQHKSTIRLTITSPAPYSKLVDDKEWQDFLASNADVEALAPPPT